MKRKLLILTTLLGLLAGIITGVTRAQQGSPVTILTPPLKKGVQVSVDLNRNGINEASEIIGVFDVYNGHGDLVFSWQADPKQASDPASFSYQVSLIQYALPYNGTGSAYTQTKVSHHWASNPNGLTFTLSSLGVGETICYGCPSAIQIVPERLSKYYDPTTQTYEYEYTPVAASLAGYQQSVLFVLEDTPLGGAAPGGSTSSDDGTCLNCGDGICDTACGEDVVSGTHYCEFDCGLP
jgi:hypothetical protein